MVLLGLTQLLDYSAIGLSHTDCECCREILVTADTSSVCEITC